MSEIKRIEDQLKRAFEGNAWHGSGVLEILRDVSASRAAARPLPGAHSIWELVLHITAWESVCRRRLEGDRAQIPDEEDWPAVGETSEVAWEQVKQGLIEGHHRLRQAIGQLDESRLDEPILPDMSSVYVTLHGAVQHDLYHAGQIAILKKAATEAMSA
ncbi:MAG: DinB family protein [Pyrinomonadaceae bacterium]